MANLQTQGWSLHSPDWLPCHHLHQNVRIQAVCSCHQRPLTSDHS
ncbi:Uncharacterised protein [Vibrio cholerae]|nr:Uncharacterised protein [Vibrio cholerae]CSI67755.1 Uncharacterised protein [Vibrio cholerae]